MQTIALLITVGIFLLLLAVSPGLALVFFLIGLIALCMSKRPSEEDSLPQPSKVKWIKRNGCQYMVPLEIYELGPDAIEAYFQKKVS